MREKVGKSRNTVFFQYFVAPEGRKVGSLKRRVRSHLARWEMKKCTPLWREVHFQVKICQNIQNTPGVGPLLEVEMSKSAPRSGPKHISKSKCTKHFSFGALLEVAMSKSCTPLWREAHFEVKMYKAHHVRTTCGCSELVSRGRRKGLCTFSKVSKTWGFCSIAKNDGRRGTLEEDLQRCIFRGRRSTRDIFIGAVRRSGRWFPERGCILEHQIFRFAEMISRDRHSTSYDLALFRGMRSTFRQVDWKNRKTHWYEAVSAAGNFPFLKEASQNYFVFDVVKCEKWRSLAELLRFWRC